jgi:phage portal protein BeeE
LSRSKGIWTETDSPAFSPVLRKPNRYQNRIQFWESWILSKLTRGNAYVLKERDNAASWSRSMCSTRTA